MEIDYGTLFSIEEGGEVQEVAEPAEDTEEMQGEEVQEVAEPDVNENNADNVERNTEGQTDEDARYAAARRRAEAERDEAIRKAREEAKAEADRTIDEAFKNSGMTNPYTKKPITSKAEYDEYRTRFEAEQKARMLRKSGMSDEEFDRFIESLPEVREAKEAKEEAERAKTAAKEAAAKVRIDEELKEISALDPSIKDINDLTKMPTYPRFYELVQKGNSLIDAFRLANFDSLTSKAAAASKQAALNSAQGKNHLAQTQTRGAGAVTVPNEIKEMYRALNPDVTDAEIQAHYSKNHKK